MIIIKNKNISMKEIANALDVSIVSISKAVNNKPGVSEQLRKKILDTAYEMGYVAQKKKPAGSIQKLAYITPMKYFFESEQFYSQIFYHINEICIQESISLSMLIINPDDERQLLVPPLISGDYFDGIFVGGELCDRYIYFLGNLNIPTVCIDFYKPDMSMDCIIVDNFYASYSVAVHLIRKGHQRIGFVGHPTQTTSILDRFFGYRKALYQFELEFNEEWQLIYSDNMDLPSEMPTAFICHNDVTAYAFINQLNSIGLDVPGDISIASFDNLDIGGNAQIPLTTVDIDLKMYAGMAFSQLIDRINNRNHPYQRVMLDVELIQRESVKTIGINHSDLAI